MTFPKDTIKHIRRLEAGYRKTLESKNTAKSILASRLALDNLIRNNIIPLLDAL